MDSKNKKKVLNQLENQIQHAAAYLIFHLEPMINNKQQLKMITQMTIYTFLHVLNKKIFFRNENLISITQILWNKLVNKGKKKTESLLANILI